MNRLGFLCLQKKKLLVCRILYHGPDLLIDTWWFIKITLLLPYVFSYLYSVHLSVICFLYLNLSETSLFVQSMLIRFELMKKATHTALGWFFLNLLQASRQWILSLVKRIW
jgi:hypothetical protein